MEIDLQLAKTAEASDGCLSNAAIIGLWFVGNGLRQINHIFKVEALIYGRTYYSSLEEIGFNRHMMIWRK